MLVRDLLDAITAHAADGRHAGDEVILVVGRETRSVEATYSDGTFTLIAGEAIRQ